MSFVCLVGWLVDDFFQRLWSLPDTMMEDIDFKRLAVALAYPLIALLYRILLSHGGSRLTRRLLSLFTIAFLYAFLEKSSLFAFLLFSAALSYVHSRLLLSWEWMPASSFVSQLGLLLLSDHYAISIQEGTFAKMVFHTVIMSLFVRTTSFVYDISDAFFARQASKTQSKKSQGKKQSSPSQSGKPKPPSSTLDFATLERFPSFFEYMSYAFFPVSIMFGPHMRFADYRNMIERPKPEDESSNEPLKRRRAYVLKGIAIIFLGYLICMMYFPLGKLLTIEETLQSPLWNRVRMCYLSFIRHRVSLYVFWYLSELAFLLLGMGLNPKTGEWDYYKNVVPEILAKTMTYGELWVFWNMHAHKFLKDYVYKRCLRWSGTSTTAAALLTFIVSSLWHGSNTGMWAVFLNMILVEIGFESIEPYINGSRFWWLFFIPNRLAFNYFIMPCFMTGREALILWRSWYYYGHIVALVYFITAQLLKKLNVRHQPPLRIVSSKKTN